MKKYITYFKLRIICEFQYRAAAIAGLSTQFFFGFIQIMLYMAFYNHADTPPIQLNQLITLIWLQQAFYSVIIYRDLDQELLDMIENGNIAYELCRPFNVYFTWFLKVLSQKMTRVVIRSIPVILISLLLKYPYNLSLPYSIKSFILFVITFFLGTLLVTSIVTIIHIITFFTIKSHGILNITTTIAEFLAGFYIPIPLMPDVFKNLIYYLPFRYVSDFPFRVYSANIVGFEVYLSIIIQIIYITLFLILGFLLSKLALKKVVVQGG